MLLEPLMYLLELTMDGNFFILIGRHEKGLKGSQTENNYKNKKMKKTILKVRAHDAIVGLLYLISAGLTIYTSNFSFLWIAFAVGGLQVISPFTKFCPVYALLNKLMPGSEPIQNGK